MFQRKGICYHTGYKPSFTTNIIQEKPLIAILRMKERLLSKEEQKEKENHHYV
jgi:hypothetical protein